jgi:hypothetical protein
MTIEEMDAHLAYMKAHNKRLYEEDVAYHTERIAIAKHPETREFYRRRLAQAHAIAARKD